MDYDNLLAILTHAQPAPFVKAMSSQHRTFQQDFTRLAVAWLEACASDEYRFDGRNEGSHEVGKIATRAFNEANEGRGICLPRV